ncbi:MAG: hypothetical protein ABJZ55_00895 [Fuerstiella sp.]
MKHKPQTLTSGRRWVPAAIFAALLSSVVLLSALPVSASAVAQQQEAGQQDSAKENASQPELRPSTQAANGVLSEVTATLKAAESLSCNIQQTILMSGQKMLAAGRYVQGTGNRMRLEYRIFPVAALHSKDAPLLQLGSEEDTTEAELADKKISGALTQISDGSVLWSKWQNGPDTQITRRNIREILDAVKDIKNTTAADSLRSLGIGGLQTLVSQLQVGMEFGQVKEQTIGGNTIYVLTGRWTQKTRKDIFKVPEGDLETPLPAYIPDYVRVYVDQKASLPRRIEYLKRHPNPEVKQAQPLAILDFRNIRLNETLNETMFDISKEEGDDSVEEKDLTRDVIDAIQAASETKATQPDVGGSTEGK